MYFSVSNPCAAFPDIQCSDICLIVDDAPKCFCGVGFKLATDQQTCIGKNTVFI